MIVSSLSKLLKKLRGEKHASLYLKFILMIIKRNQDDMFLFRQITFKNKTSLKMESITVQGLQSRKVTTILWSILWRSFVLKQIKACITRTDTKIIHTIDLKVFTDHLQMNYLKSSHKRLTIKRVFLVYLLWRETSISTQEITGSQLHVGWKSFNKINNQRAMEEGDKEMVQKLSLSKKKR
jgi:hypothetical protein